MKNGDLDYDSLAEAVFTATVALNEVLDEGLKLHPLEEQRQSVSDWRQIGLGIFGCADMLIKMGIRYGSEEAIELCRYLSNFILNYSLLASTTLAMDKGTYKYYNYDYVSETPFYKENVWTETDNAIKRYGLRNSQLLTIAPTGSLSTMIGVSGGVEPIFANYYMRKTQSLHGEDVFYKVYTPIVKQYMEEHNIKDDEDLPEFFITSQKIPPIERIKFQEAWQNSIDASISSTINLPEETTVEDIEEIYLQAWKHNLKGVTIFRDKCKRTGVLITETPNENTAPTLKRGEIKKISEDVVGKKRRLISGCGPLHCSAFFDKLTGELLEVFLDKGSQGGCDLFMNGLSRMISLAARAGCSVYDIVDQLESCGTCPSYAVRRATKHDTSPGSCCPTAVGKALLDMATEMKEELGLETDLKTIEVSIKVDGPSPAHEPKIKYVCPECGEPLVFEGGCQTCKNCGWSKCG